MNWYSFLIFALISNGCTIKLAQLACKDPQRATSVMENIEHKGRKPLICIICLWTATIYLYSYVEFYSDQLINELFLNFGMIIFLFLWGGVLSFFIKQLNDSGEKTNQIVTLDICIALLAFIGFFCKYGEYANAMYFIGFILGRFFWLDNINFKNISSVFKELRKAIKAQGYVTTTGYIMLLFFVFKIGMSSATQITQEISSGIAGGLATSIPSMCVVAFVRRKSQNMKHIEQTESEQ